MHDLGALNILRLPLQVLWEFPDIATRIRQGTPELESDFTKWFSAYSIDVQENMLVQLRWATLHPTYNFTEILKKVRTSNEDILEYFRFLEQVFTRCMQQ